MIVLITGATGFLGTALSARLKAAGHALRILSRNPQATSASSNHPALPAPPPGLPPEPRVFAWPAGGPVPDAALDGADAVVHLAGENIGQWPWSPSRKRRILDSRVQGTRALVDAIARASRKPSVLVAASAVGYYGDGGDALLAESAPPGRGFLAEVCVAWERESLRAESLGVRTVVVRNGLVLGRGGALEKLLPAFRFGLGPVLGSGEQWWSWIHIEDAAGIFAFALDNPELRGPVNGTAPDPLRQRDFALALAAAVHRPRWIRAPAWALRLGLGEMASTLLESQRTDGKKPAAMGYAFRYPRIGLALGNITSGVAHA